MIEMTVHRVGLCTQDGSPVIILREQHGLRFLPVRVSSVQANAIMRHSHHIPPFRPQTHETFIAALRAMGASIANAYVADIAEQGFGARISIVRRDEVVSVPCSAADAIVLAVRGEAPILVSPALLDRLASSGATGSQTLPSSNEALPSTSDSAPDAFRQFIDSLSTIDDLGR